MLGFALSLHYVSGMAAFNYYQRLVVEVDQEIQRQLGSLETATNAEPTVPKRTN
jgi:hypothetical protein